MKKYSFIIGGIIVILLAAWYFYVPEGTLGKSASDFQKFATDIIGTKSGTSTTPVTFYSLPATNGTSTKAIKLGTTANTAVFTIYAKEATSSQVIITFQILASNDDYCATATTTSSMDSVIVSEINWFDAYPYVKGLANSNTLATGTTTFSWVNPEPGTGREVVLTDLAVECLQFRINGSSTAVWVQERHK